MRSLVCRGRRGATLHREHHFHAVDARSPDCESTSPRRQLDAPHGAVAGRAQRALVDRHRMQPLTVSISGVVIELRPIACREVLEHFLRGDLAAP